MITNRHNRFLRSEAGELPAGGSAAAPVAAAAAAEPAAPVAPAAAAAPVAAVEKPGLLQMAVAAAQSKGALLAKASTFEARAIAAETERDTLKGKLSAALGELATLCTERQQIAEALTSAQGEVASAEEKAAGIVASMGIDPVKVPAAAQGGVETLESLHAQLAAETDPDKRWDLAAKINAKEMA
jgi:hypothetical protein